MQRTQKTAEDINFYSHSAIYSHFIYKKCISL